MRLDFDQATHTYRIDGQLVPSVTEVLGDLNDFARIQPEVLAAAAAFGNHVHEACNLFDRGELDEARLDPLLLPYVNSWAGFLELAGATVISSECRVGHQTYGYAGTFDRLLDWKGPALVDLKSSVGVPRTVGPQTAAYGEALMSGRSGRKPRRYCVHLQPDGRPGKAIPLLDTSDFSIFISALNLYNWRRQNAA